MLQPLQDLHSFITNRFTPCIYCFASQEALNNIENIAQKVLNVWSRIMTENYNNIRIIFPFVMPNVGYMRMELMNPRLFDQNSEPFSFLGKPLPDTQNKELNTTKLIRQRFFEMSFLPPECFCDIPVASLVVLQGSESPNINFKQFPAWSVGYISRIPQVPIRIPAEVDNPDNTLYQSLKMFYDNIVVRIPRIFAEKEAIYNSEWGRKSTISMFFTSEERYYKLVIIMKHFADTRMMQNRYKEASVLYKRLSEMKGPIKLISQCRLMAALSSIASGDIEGVEDHLKCALEGSSSPGEACGINLCLLWMALLRKTGIYIAPLNKTLKIMTEIKEFDFLIPFIMEQAACFKKDRQNALILALASKRFMRFSAIEHAAKCLWGAFNNSKGMPELVQFNGSAISQTCYKENNVDLSMIVHEIVQCRNVYIPDELAAMIEKYPPGKCECGFVRPLAVLTQAKGFVSTIPKGFSGSWPEHTKTVFAAYSGFNQFKVGKKIDCEVGGVVKVNVCLRCSCTKFLMEDIELVANSGSIETKKITVDPSKQKFVELSFIPKSEGEIIISGIEFKWCNALLESKFDHLPLELNAHSNLPKIAVEKQEMNLESIAEDDIFQIEFNIRNVGKTKINHLDLQIYGDTQINLIQPYEREYSGFKFLSALEEGQEFKVRIAIKANLGKHNIGILLPYWTNGHCPRYEHFYISYEGHEADDFTIDADQCSVNINCAPYTPAGFTSLSFDCKAHSSISDENKLATLSLIAKENEEKEPFNIPDFCRSFGLDGVRVWIKKNESTYTSRVLDKFVWPIAILIKKIGVDKYMAYVTNIGKQAIHSIKFSFLDQNQKVAFIVSGIELRIIDVIKPGDTESFPFSLVYFDIHDNDFPPKIMIAADEFVAVPELKL